MASPYSDYTDEQLLAEFEANDEYIKVENEHLVWAQENDNESGIIEVHEDNLDHAIADYNWMKKELFDRGFSHNSLTDSWHKKELK